MGTGVDSEGNVYVVDKWNQVIQKFDRFGNFVEMWGQRGQGDGKCFNFPRFMHIDSNDKLYISDDNHIRIFDEHGTFIERIAQHFIMPGATCTDKNHNLWVPERQTSEVWKLNEIREVEFILPQGTENGKFNAPTGVWVDNNCYAYITDRKNNRIQKIDSSGEFELLWKGFNGPAGIVGDSCERIYISELWGDWIKVFTSEGENLAQWDIRGDDPPEYHTVWQIDMDGDYFLYLADNPNDYNLVIDTARVHKYALIPDFDVYGKPNYTPGESMGYFIWRDIRGGWHIHWTGEGFWHAFSGTIHSTTHILNVVPISHEAYDTYKVSTNRIDFDAGAGAGEDGFRFDVESKGIITFDLMIDGVRESSSVTVGWMHRKPTSLPLPLLSK